MNIERHTNLTQVLQFLGFFVFLVAFLVNVDTLKSHGLFHPALFLLGPVIPVVVIRIVMTLSFPPPCPRQSCRGRLLLNLTRSRNYHCDTCGSKFKASKPNRDPNYRKRVNKLLYVFLAIIVSFVSIAIYGIIRQNF